MAGVNLSKCLPMEEVILRGEKIVLEELRMAAYLMTSRKIGDTVLVRRRPTLLKGFQFSQEPLAYPVVITPELLELLEPAAHEPVEFPGVAEGMLAVRFGVPVREGEFLANGAAGGMGLVVVCKPGYCRQYIPVTDTWDVIKLYETPVPVTLFARHERDHETILRLGEHLKANAVNAEKKE